MTLKLRNVSLVQDGVSLIDDANLTLQRRTMNVLLGPTLAGKTTLMRLMAGLDRPTYGQILIDNADVTGVAVRKRSVAMVYQQFVNYPGLTVYENIASPLRVARLPAAEIESRVSQAAALLQLERFFKRLPAELSGGQQQRVAIARALVKRADLVLLDEPLANLDYKLREELREELPRLFASTGAILVYATTEPIEALLLGGTTVILCEGRITQAGPAPQLYRRPANLESARAFSDPPLNELSVTKNRARLTLHDGRTFPASGRLAALDDGTYSLGFRAEAATLWPVSAPAINFSGTITVTEVSGSESFVHVDVGGRNWVCLLPGVHDREPGSTTELYVDIEQIFVFGADGAVIEPRGVAASPSIATAD